jgi:hypothetical protein
MLSIVVEPFSSLKGDLAADCPILYSSQTFTLVVTDYVVVIKTLRSFQQLKRFFMRSK